MNKLLVLVLITFSSVFAFSQKELTQEVYFDTDKYDVPNTEGNRLLLFISTLNDIDIESISIFDFHIIQGFWGQYPLYPTNQSDYLFLPL